VKWVQRLRANGGGSDVTATPHTEFLPGIGVVEIARTLNCVGAVCPRPQMLTMRMLEELSEGEVIELISDNPATVETLPALMYSHLGTHLATVKGDEHWRVYMRKGIIDEIQSTNLKGER